MQKLDLIRETQICEFEAAIQPIIQEKHEEKKRKGKQPIIEEEKTEEKKRIKRRRGGEDEGQYKKPRKAHNKQLVILNYLAYNTREIGRAHV